MLSALAGLAALQGLAYLHAGVFEYPLDDVYIHLAMASNIVQGHYGADFSSHGTQFFLERSVISIRFVPVRF